MDHLFIAPKSRLRELKLDAVSLKARATASQNEKLYLELLVMLAECFIERTTFKLEQLKLVSPSFDDIERNVAEVKGFVRYLDNLIKVVHKSHPADIPIGTNGLVKDLFSRMTDEKLHFFLNISPQEEAYSTSPDLIRNIKQMIEKEFGKKTPESCNKNIVNFNLYATQAKDILRHSILAHEAGHVLVRFDKSYEQGMKNLFKILAPDILQMISPMSQQLKTVLSTAYMSWMEEFYVDLVSVYSLGPAALLTMKELMTEEIDFASSVGQTHPAIYKRAYLMWKTVEKIGYLQFLDSKIKSDLEAFIDRCKLFFQSSPSDFAQLNQMDSLFDQKNLDKISDEFLSCGLKGLYAIDEFENEVPELVNYLSVGIASCEIPNSNGDDFVTVSGPSLLNAAWIIEEKKILETEKLNPVLNKALSSLYLKKQWDEAKQ